MQVTSLMRCEQFWLLNKECLNNLQKKGVCVLICGQHFAAEHFGTNDAIVRLGFRVCRMQNFVRFFWNTLYNRLTVY